jgi:hypothetical protein
MADRRFPTRDQFRGLFDRADEICREAEAASIGRESAWK